VYLASLLTEENDGSKENQRRIARATRAMEQFGKKQKYMYQHRNQMNIMKSTVMNMASETGILEKKNRDRLLAFEMKCY